MLFLFFGEARWGPLFNIFEDSDLTQSFRKAWAVGSSSPVVAEQNENKEGLGEVYRVTRLGDRPNYKLSVYLQSIKS